MIIDSDVLIDFLKDDKRTVAKIKEIEEVEELKTTSINTFEILKGFFALNKKEENIINFINNLMILDFDFQSSEKAAEIFDELRKRGEIIDTLDLFIASIAIVNNETLITRNSKHFQRIPELKITEF
tara:strand:- start:92 stop:472 length:381 start_codon:yes stop_codon:yes gene_type:complete